MVPTNLEKQPIKFYLRLFNGTSNYTGALDVKVEDQANSTFFEWSSNEPAYKFKLFQNYNYVPPVPLSLNVLNFKGSEYTINTFCEGIQDQLDYVYLTNLSRPNEAKLLLSFNKLLPSYNYVMSDVLDNTILKEGLLHLTTNEKYEIDIKTNDVSPDKQPRTFKLQFFKTIGENREYYTGPVTFHIGIPEDSNIIYMERNFKLYTNYTFTPPSPPSTITQPSFIYTVILVVVIVLFVAFYGKFLKTRFFN